MTRAVVFAYSEVGVRCLRVLMNRGVRIDLVVTHEDDPTERQWFGSVASLAKEHRIPVTTPANPNAADVVEGIVNLRPDFLFSFYYRHMLCEQLLAAPTRGALNMHGSLLPKYRGRAPVNWAILNGETETGASLHYMQARPDAGPLVGQEPAPIFVNDTALMVSLKVANAAEQLLERCLPELIAGSAAAVPLDLAQGSYFGRRRPADGKIHWDRPALEIHNLIRAVAPPFPGAFGDFDGQILRVLGSRYHGRPSRHPVQAPCLYSDNGYLQLDCRDGKQLTLTQAELDGTAFTVQSLVVRYGATPIPLSASIVRQVS